MGKPRGIRTARKLVIRRRNERWADKDYKKANFGRTDLDHFGRGRSSGERMQLERGCSVTDGLQFH